MSDEDEITQELIVQAKSEIVSFELAAYVALLEEQAEQYRHQIMAAQADMSIQKDHMLGLYDLMDRRPRDRRLAQVLCDWMNLHQDKKAGWKICQCELCKETKSHMNALGDPIIHTGRGWECTEGREEFQTRNVAKEFVDNTPKLGQPIHDTEGVPLDGYPAKRGPHEAKEK